MEENELLLYLLPDCIRGRGRGRESFIMRCPLGVHFWMCISCRDDSRTPKISSALLCSARSFVQPLSLSLSPLCSAVPETGRDAAPEDAPKKGLLGWGVLI